jgi:virginiamycin B lyase
VRSPTRSKRARPSAGIVATLLALLLTATPSSASELTSPINLGGVKVADLAAGADGTLFYAGRSYGPGVQDEIGRVAPGGEVTRFPLPEREERFTGIGGIAVGPGGDVWFTESNSYRIGRVTLGGQVSEFFVPIYGARPKQIVVGPDGNIWFTDSYSVVSYAPGDGSFKEIDLPPGADPAGITVGPDGAIWFAERGMGHIGRISMGGQYTRYEVPAVSHPREIVVGPDHNLWFSDEEAPRIGRITTGGQITLFPVPAKSGTEQLVSGPRGLLWYSSGVEIGTISTGGEVTEPECMLSTCQLSVSALTRGTDDDLWVATDGFLSRFLPSVRVSIGRHPSRIRGRYLTVGLWCDGGVLERPCEGALRLNGLVPRPGRGGKPMTLLLANSRFSLAGDSGGRIRLRLRGRPFRLLAGRNRIKAWAYTSNAVEGEGPVALTLRR